MKWLYDVQMNDLGLAFELYIWVTDAGREAEYDFEKGVLIVYG